MDIVMEIVEVFDIEVTIPEDEAVVDFAEQYDIEVAIE